MDIKLRPNCMFTQGRCALCGGWFDWEAVVAVAYDSGEQVGDVCTSCLEAGPHGIRERMRDFADSLHAWANDLEELADDVIMALPTIEEYHTQCRYGEAFLGGETTGLPWPTSAEWLAYMWADGDANAL